LAVAGEWPLQLAQQGRSEAQQPFVHKDEGGRFFGEALVPGDDALFNFIGP
jgi:hypothetical protein